VRELPTFPLSPLSFLSPSLHFPTSVSLLQLKLILTTFDYSQHVLLIFCHLSLGFRRMCCLWERIVNSLFKLCEGRSGLDVLLLEVSPAARECIFIILSSGPELISFFFFPSLFPSLFPSWFRQCMQIWSVHKRVCGGSFKWPALKIKERDEMIELSTKTYRGDEGLTTWLADLRALAMKECAGFSFGVRAMGGEQKLFRVSTVFALDVLRVQLNWLVSKDGRRYYAGEGRTVVCSGSRGAA